jgi:hypothetical protein
MSFLTIKIRFEVFTAVAMKNDIEWDVKPCGSWKNRPFEGRYHLHLQDDRNRRRCMRWLLVTANVVPSSLILVTLMMEALRSSEMSVLIRATWHNVLKEGILHKNESSVKYYENLKFLSDCCAFKNSASWC